MNAVPMSSALAAVCRPRFNAWSSQPDRSAADSFFTPKLGVRPGDRPPAGHDDPDVERWDGQG